MKRHSINITAQCAFDGPKGRCQRKTTTTHPYCAQHTQTVLGVRVAPSKIKGAGLGLYAVRPFKKGEHVVEYRGEKLTQKEYDTKYADDAMGSYGISLSARYVLDAGKTSSGVARYVCDYHGSHSKPNTEYVNIDNRIWVVAIRDIKVGEEFYSDYGEDMHKAMGLK
jgi:SET domain-containing protein